jgi:3-oxoacyl-[acyl-carrier-protein] synthase III
MHAFVAGIEYFLPKRALTTEELSSLFPAWSVEAIDAKTGIRHRHIAGRDECASDLGVAAALRLFRSGTCRPSDIDFLLFCTQSPDYVLPTTACLVQDRLGISMNAGAIDCSIGCSGFVYGLGISEGLIASGQAMNILLITADTYSKYINESDRTSRTLFGDGAAATLIRGRSGDAPTLGPFVYGTNGEGANDLIVRNSGTRLTYMSNEATPVSETGRPEPGFLTMNGPRIFQFAISTVPRAVSMLLEKAEMTMDDIDLFVFHQANAYLLEELRRRLRIPQEKFQVTISHCANTVSSTIPIALKHAELEGKLKIGHVIMLVGFGVGYSWSATIVRWSLP